MKTKKIESKLYDLKIIEILERDKFGDCKTREFVCKFKENLGAGFTSSHFVEAKTLKELIKIIDKELREYKPIYMTKWEKLLYKLKQILIILR